MVRDAAVNRERIVLMAPPAVVRPVGDAAAALRGLATVDAVVVGDVVVGEVGVRDTFGTVTDLRPRDIAAREPQQLRRVVLRELWPDEARRLLSGRREPTWAPGYPLEDTRPPAEALIAADASGQWQAGFGMYQIQLLDAGTVIGDIGFHSAPDNGSVEIGYGIVPQHRGNGYVTRSVVALCEWALRQPDVHEVRAETSPGNTPSQRVLVRAGFTFVDTTGEHLRYRYAR